MSKRTTMTRPPSPTRVAVALNDNMSRASQFQPTSAQAARSMGIDRPRGMISGQPGQKPWIQPSAMPSARRPSQPDARQAPARSGVVGNRDNLAREPRIRFLADSAAPAIHRTPSPPATSYTDSATGILYLVKKGDNLFRIAGAHGVQMMDIMRLNRDNLGMIHPDDSLKLPKNPKGVASHKVKQGEYLWSIAETYIGDDAVAVNRFVNKMLRANLEFLARKNLKAGMYLRIDGKRDASKKNGTSQQSGKSGTTSKTGGTSQTGHSQTGTQKPHASGSDRLVDAKRSFSTTLAERSISIKGVQFNLAGKLEAQLASKRGKAVTISAKDVTVNLKQWLGQELKVGLDKDGRLSLEGKISEHLGSLKVTWGNGGAFAYKSKPVEIPTHPASNQGYVLKLTLIVEVTPSLNLKKATATSFAKRLGKLLVKRFGRKLAQRGTLMLIMSAADGPLPVGELLSLGLSIWTIIELIAELPSLWRAAQGG